MAPSPTLIEEAKAHCEATGSRLTPPRERVLTIIAKAAKPLGAYDIIEQMPTGTKPPTVYRALEFWEQEGFLHRISSLNVYSACKAGHRHSGGQFLICNNCGSVTETHICDTPKDFSTEAKKNNFQLDGWFLELRGLCSKCTEGKTHAHSHNCDHHH